MLNLSFQTILKIQNIGKLYFLMIVVLFTKFPQICPVDCSTFGRGRLIWCSRPLMAVWSSEKRRQSEAWSAVSTSTGPDSDCSHSHSSLGEKRQRLVNIHTALYYSFQKSPRQSGFQRLVGWHVRSDFESKVWCDACDQPLNNFSF